MQPTLEASAEAPYELLRAICARAGLDTERVDPVILARMRLLAATTETLRDCERCSELAEAFFRYDDACKPDGRRFSLLERQSVVIGTLFSDIGKSGPETADAQGQHLIAEMYTVENVIDGNTLPVRGFFDTYFPTDAPDRVRRFRGLGLDPDMTMRAFWNLHSMWTLQILRGDGVPPGAVIAASAHHLLENVNPLAAMAEDPRLKRYFEGAFFDRAEKLVVLLDKYDAARRRGKRSHDGAIEGLRKLIADHPRFRDDQEFFALIDGLDAVIQQRAEA